MQESPHRAARTPPAPALTPVPPGLPDGVPVVGDPTVELTARATELEEDPEPARTQSPGTSRWSVRRRARGWLRRGQFERGPAPAIILIVTEMVLIAPLTFLLAGRATAIFHAFYLPVVLAANRFRWRGAVVTGLAAGLLCGPLRPVNDLAGPAQRTWGWGLRTLAFILVGLLVAWLSSRGSTSIATVVRERGNARALRDALARGDLQAHYQPIFDLQTGAVIGFEALCRWTDPAHGSIPPSDFIPLAERTGVIVPLGRHMLVQATTQAAIWQAAGAAGVLVTVNVSAEQLSRSDLLHDVVGALRTADIASAHLCLEITETAVIRDPVAAMTTVRAAHDLGVLVALDDFGTGHSSLAYLKDFPIDIIKIDKVFIDDVDVDPKASALVLAIIELAHALGATTIAEGIERHSQLESLRLLGCDRGQGFLMGRPAPAETWGP